MLQDSRVVSLIGDRDHPYNQGILCPKSRRFLDLVYSGQRLTEPLLRQRDRFKPISWDKAFAVLIERLEEARGEYGPTSVLHYSDYAHSGLLHNNVDKLFFRAFGGSSKPVGSLCMSAGVAAVKEAFGQMAVSDVRELTKAKTIILWGSNPARTHVPLMPYLRNAKEQGAKIILIDPIKTESAKYADSFLAPRPGSDTELALGLAQIIILEGAYDDQFISEYSEGFAEFKDLAFSLNKSEIADATGISWSELEDLAHELIEDRPVSILPGFGLQRRVNGAQIIQALASLVALTGSIGQPGGGLHYSHSYWDKLADISGGKEYPDVLERDIKRGRLATELLQADPKIQVALIKQTNPVVQSPRSDLVVQALQEIPFVVVMDMFMTPTACLADLVLPVTSFLEDLDLIHNSWHPYLALSKPVIDPIGKAKSDSEIFLELGARMGLFTHTRRELIEAAIKPLEGLGLTWERLEQGPWRHPEAPLVAWQEQRFPTASGRFRFWTGRQKGFPFLRQSAPNPDYPYTLLSPQPKERTHSQGGFLQEDEELTFYLHPETAGSVGITNGSLVRVSTPTGEVAGVAVIDDQVHPEVILTYNGLWPKKPGSGLNALVPEGLSTAGDQAAMYDCPAKLRGR